MDVLSDVLRVARLSSAVFFTADLSAPWALVSPHPPLLASVAIPEAAHLSIFHILTEGNCIIECGGAATRLQTGDVVAFPHGDAHTMRSHAGAALTPLERVFPRRERGARPRLTLGGGGPATRFVCGYLGWEERFRPLAEELPAMMVAHSGADHAAVETADEGERSTTTVPREPSNWLATTLHYAVSEAGSGRPGHDAMLRRLIELMFLEIIREYMQRPPRGRVGWLAALDDRHVGMALRLLHADPERNWTVGNLAREVALSRSALAQRFTRLIGMPPMQYLATWRMQLARQMLRDGAANVQTVAARVGYESEPAFTRAFKRATGMPPAAWRRRTG